MTEIFNPIINYTCSLCQYKHTVMWSEYPFVIKTSGPSTYMPCCYSIPDLPNSIYDARINYHIINFYKIKHITVLKTSYEDLIAPKIDLKNIGISGTELYNIFDNIFIEEFIINDYNIDTIQLRIYYGNIIIYLTDKNIPGWFIV